MSASAVTRNLLPVSHWYQRLSVRERLLVMLCVLSLTWLLWQSTLDSFLADAEARLAREVSLVQGRLQNAVKEQAALQLATTQDPNLRLAAERARLDAELRQLDASVRATLGRFVAPERMPALMEDVIRHNQGLKLKRIVSLPVESVQMASAGDPAETSDASSPRIYRHPLRLQLEGSYFDVVAYLSELEKGPWELGWRQLDYEVIDYPLAQVTIEIETLSSEENWIGI
jgi:MSHA biogenesis protein MshJ